MYSFDTYIRVEYVDTDKMGVVHNSNYFRYFERARCETMRDIGVNYKDIEVISTKGDGAGRMLKSFMIVR